METKAVKSTGKPAKTRKSTKSKKQVPASRKNEILVIGLGNFLMGDRGIGVHIAQRMNLMHLESYINVGEIGGGEFLPLNYFEAYRKIIFVDAVMDGDETGTISHIKTSSANDFSKTLSVHDVRFSEMLQMLFASENHPEIHLITISISDISPMHVGFSEDIDEAIDRAIWRVIDLADDLHLHQ